MAVSSRRIYHPLMKLRIGTRVFDTEEVYEISIRESQREVFVTTQDDFFRIKYRSEEEIKDVIYWKKLTNITTADLHNAIYTLIITCDYFINSKLQCNGCPLFQHNHCILTTIPNNWRE